MLSRKIKFWLAAIFFATVGVFVLTQTSFAAFGLEYATASGLGTIGLKPMVFSIINVILGFLGLVALVIVMYGGFVWMTAGGNPERVSRAKKILFNGLIGLLLILASWGIANFVLGQLWGATGGGGPTPGSPCDCATELGVCSGCLRCQNTGGPGVCTWQSDVTCGPTCIGLPGAKTFYAQKFQPTSPPDAIRNAVVRITFKGINTTSQPGAINYGANFSVLDMSVGPPGVLVSPDVAGGYPRVAGNRLEFKPDTDCPPPNASYKCFDPFKDYKIVVTNGLQNTAGINLDCAGYSCEATFRTNDIIDTTAPTISVSATKQICAGTANNQVDAHGTDDSGIAYVEFYYNDGATDTLFETDNAPSCAGLPPSVSCSAQSNWDTTAPQFSAGGAYFLKAKAMDLDSNEKMSSAYKVILRAAHCCNSFQDLDEEAVDCGGADCAACDGSACDIDTPTPGCQPDDMVCASVFCDPAPCTCQQPPIIDQVIPDDGAPGNFITLWGRSFGATAGTVTFLGAAGPADDRVAPFPNSVNSNCGNSWTEKQIVVVAPAGAVDGPIRVTTSGGYSDETNDARGPVIADFDVNTTVRPGLCLANPISGPYATAVHLTGVRFGPATPPANRTVEFGNDVSFVTADNISWDNPTANQDVDVTVPNLRPAKVGLRVKVDSEYSNYLTFTVTPGVTGGPRIDYIDPTSGPENQYVTIFGSNFGSKVGTVTFGGLTAKTNFPTQCQNNFWHNSYIIVKAPAVAPPTNYPVQIKRSDGKLSNDDVIFTGAAGTAGPGICALIPDNGPVGTAIDFFGDNFGGAPGRAVFYNNQSAAVTSWASQQIRANVPLGALSGNVFAENNAVPAQQSNQVPFKVAACENDSECDTAVPEKCCPDKTCRAQCPEKIQAVYGWSFTTGDYFVARDCIKEGIGIPATGPTGQDVCINAQIAVRFTTLVNNDTVVNPADASIHPNVIIEKCTGPETDPCSAASEIAGAITMVTLATDPQTEGLTFTPSPVGSVFDQNATYRVTLRGGEGAIEDESGTPLIDDFSWTFKTRADTKQCQLAKIMVEPSQAKLVLLGAMQDYVATTISKENPCWLINPLSYTWAWQSSKTEVAIVSAPPSTDNTETAVAMGGGTTEIKASIPAENKSGAARLTVDLSGLQVLSAVPNCDKACVNAQIRARFSNRIDDNTLTANNIKLYQCADKNCLFSGLAPVNLINPATTYFWNGLTGDSILDINPPAPLNANTFYRVIIKGGSKGIKNYLGGPLSNPNYKAGWGEECEPPAANCGVNCLRTSGECTPGMPGCSPAGIHTGSVASSCGNGVVEPVKGENCDPNNPSFGPSGCDSSKCLLKGSIFPAICGDGVLDQIHGEACDDTNQTAGDGCSVKCLNEGSLSTCGNGLLDPHEDCDDGNTQGGDGCSAKCLAEGTVGSVCGDRQIGVGEDCDDGNTANGDGCSDKCLNEGATGLAVCGNGAVEDGKVNDSYAWVFGTTATVCQPKSAEIIPANVIAKVSDKINYLANLYSTSDECSPRGQLLNANNYLWDWTSDDMIVASVTNDGTPKQVADALSIGTAQICAAADIDKNGGFADPVDVKGCGNLTVSQIISTIGTPCQPPAKDNQCCKIGVPQCLAGLFCLSDLAQPECPLETPGSGKYPGCLCCCDPINDQCPAPLACYRDKTPCSGLNRGLCCGCKNDGDCGGLPGTGCGNDSCCHARPQVSNTSPANGAAGICRNVKIAITFNEPMKTSSFVGKVTMIKVADGSAVKGATSAGGNTILYFSPDKTLEETTTYQITVSGQVLNQYQVAMGIDYSLTFTTGTIICDADYLRISITHDAQPPIVTNSDLFTCAKTSGCVDDIDGATADNQHLYLAETVDLTGVALTGYDYSWQTTDPDDIVNPNAAANPAITVTANNKNGRATYNIKATPQPTSGNVGVVSNYVYVTNFICENPWPAVNNWPWIDDASLNPNSICNTPGCSNVDTHFQIMYCRDAGGPGPADDLPLLNNPPLIPGQSGNLLKEFYFVMP